MKYKIFIDAGHNYSGEDTGAEGNGLKEQDITYEVAIALGNFLKKVGVDIKYSRETETSNVGSGSLSSSINKRCELANTWGADYFISLHCDASTSTSAKGSHICIYKKGSVAEKIADSINPHLLEIGLEGRSELISIRKDLGVLENTSMPAILIEMGFISNFENAKLQRDNPDKIAKAIFNGICDFLNIENNITINTVTPTPKEYLSATDSISVLINKGIIVEGDKWYNGTWDDNDFKWLLRKVGTYINEH